MKTFFYIFIHLFLVGSKVYSQKDTNYLAKYAKHINSLIDAGKFSLALQKADTLFTLAKQADDKTAIAESYNIKGNIAIDKSNLRVALDNYLNALTLYEELKDKKMVVGMYNNLGLIYRRIKEYKIALSYYYKSEKINLKYGYKQNLAINYNNIANCYQKTEDYTAAEVFINKAINLMHAIKDTAHLAMAYHNKAVNYELQDNIDSAIVYFNTSLSYLDENEKGPGHAYNYSELGHALTLKHKYKEAEEYLLKGLVLTEEFELDGIKNDIYNYLSKNYWLKKDFENAYKYQSLHVAKKEELEGDEVKNGVLKRELEYDFNTQKKEQAANAKRRELEDKVKIEAQKKITLYALIALAFLIVLIIIILRNYAQKRKANFIIQKQKEIFEHKNKEIVDSINYAQYIQNALLPSEKTINALNIKCFVLYKPKDIVSGDFYWIHQSISEKNEQEIYLAVADCTGHGVPGAMVSVVGNNGLNRCVKEFGIHETGKILDKLSELVEETFDKSENDLKDGMDISLLKITSQKDSTDIKIQWSGANNPLWIIRNDTRQLEQIKANKQPVGKYADRKPFATHEVLLKKNDRIYLFTDGYADQFGGGNGKKFKYKQLEDLCLETFHLSLSNQKRELESSFINWKGEMEQVDDICIIGICL